MSHEIPPGGVQAVFPGRGAAASAAGRGAPSRRGPHHEGGGAADPAVSEMYRQTALFPAVPKKIVSEDHALLEVFRRSASFQKILCYLQGCAESISSTPFSMKARGAVVAALKAAAQSSTAAAAEEAAKAEEEGGAAPASEPRLHERKPEAAGNPSTAVLSVEGEAAPFAPVVTFFLTGLFPFLNKLVDDIPLEDMSQQRFGNRAKREFHKRMEAALPDWTRRLVDVLPEYRGRDSVPYSYDIRRNAFTLKPPTAPVAQGPDAADSNHGGGAVRTPPPPPTHAPTKRTEAEKRQLSEELATYVKDAFGNATRLDYGTGHELHFFVTLMICLEELGDRGGTLLTDPAERERNIFVPLPTARPAPVPAEGLESTRELRRQMIFYVFQEYLTFARRLQRHYSLEPAGSHGVWGLDDFHHLPYIFGAAQLIGRDQPMQKSSGETPSGTPAASSEVILTKYVCDKAKVREYADAYMYFQMIEWILENKSGPFFEHSNMLYNISAVERWFKTYGGLIKMYAAEVLSKFNVVQHLLFGVHLPWNTQSLDTQPEDIVAPPAQPQPQDKRSKTEAEHFL